MLNNRLRNIRKNLTKPKTVSAKTKKVLNTTVSKGSLKDDFNNTKSFKSLQKLLKQLDTEKSADLLAFSEQGMALFPAQPIVYLMNGKALNNNKAYKKALRSLQSGIDFVIDDDTLEKQFYSEMSIAYRGLGDTKNTLKYQNKL